MKLLTGFSLIDRTIGSIPSKTSLLVSGPRDTGKTYFSTKMCSSNIRRGVPALFVSLDRPGSEMIPMFIRLMGRKLLADSLDNERMRFFDLYEYDFESRDITLGEVYQQTRREIHYYDQLPGLVIVDSFNRIVDNYPKEEVSELVSLLSEDAKKAGASCVFVVRTGPGRPVLRKNADGEMLFKRADEKVIIKAGLPGVGKRIFMGEYDGKKLRVLEVIE